MRKKYKIFTTEREIARLRELWRDNIAIERIAEEFACSVNAVALACRRLGLRRSLMAAPREARDG
jgi:hypothetical protein